MNNTISVVFSFIVYCAAAALA